MTGLRSWMARSWAHRRLSRGRCSICRRPLPDTGTVVAGYRVCSAECSLVAAELEAW